MEHILFNPAFLKIKRADKHIRELRNMLDSFGKTGGYRLDTKRDPKTGDRFVTFGMLEKVSDDISVIVGDIVHNLRAALDLVAYELVKRCGGTPTINTKFPFKETRQEVVAAIKGGVIDGLPLDLQTFIIDVIEPHKGGNDPLYALHAMDIADKHHALIHTRAVAGLTVKTITEEGPLDHYVFTTEQSGDVGEVRISHDVEIKDYDQPTLHVSFGEVDGFQNKPIFPTLEQLWYLVAGLVTAIADEYVALREQPPLAT